MLDKHGFNRGAGAYDDRLAEQVNSFPFIGYYDVLATVAGRADAKPGMRVLDVGIGTGLLSEELSTCGCRIHGIDFSEAMLAKAQARIPEATLALADVASDYLGPFSDRQFDRIVSSYFLHHLDPRQQMSFLRRARLGNLAPGGMIVIADVGFATPAAYDKAHVEHEALWDEEEYYLCGEQIVARLQQMGIPARYEQISACAGLLVLKR